MSRQVEPRRLAALWVVERLDVDPLRLPARFTLSVAGRAAHLLRVRDHVSVGRYSVAIERRALGFRLHIRRYPLSAFDGVALRIDTLTGNEASPDRARLAGAPAPQDGKPAFIYTINLHHRDENLCFPLYMAFDDLAVGAQWQSFGRMMRLPLLVPALDGSFRPADSRLGLLHVKAPVLRDNKVSLNSRRPLMHFFRAASDIQPRQVVCGAEIIARQ